MVLDKFLGNNVQISPLSHIGNNVKIGDNTIIYDNVIIEDNTVICNDCVIGEPLNDYYFVNNYKNPQTIIGSNSLIRSHTIIYAGNKLGSYFHCGHRATIREHTVFGEHCSVGTLNDIQGYSKFGNYCRLHSNVHIGMESTLGNYVWVFPYTVFTNDPTPPSEVCIGPTIGDFSIISTHCLLLPGVVIGKNCLVGASSLVSKSIEDYKVAIGSPAKVVKDIRDIKDRETGESHYPWPYRFSRGMPWEGMGFDEWMRENQMKIQ